MSDFKEERCEHGALFHLCPLHTLEELAERMSRSPLLLPCPKCKCDDLEGSPFPADREGNWEIACGHPDCDMFLVSSDRKLLITVWNLIVRTIEHE